MEGESQTNGSDVGKLYPNIDISLKSVDNQDFFDSSEGSDNSSDDDDDKSSISNNKGFDASEALKRYYNIPSIPQDQPDNNSVGDNESNEEFKIATSIKEESTVSSLQNADEENITEMSQLEIGTSTDNKRRETRVGEEMGEERVIEFGEGKLGMTLKRTPTGRACIQAIVPGTQAATNGAKVGDIILELCGKGFLFELKRT